MIPHKVAVDYRQYWPWAWVPEIYRVEGYVVVKCRDGWVLRALGSHDFSWYRTLWGAAVAAKGMGNGNP